MEIHYTRFPIERKMSIIRCFSIPKGGEVSKAQNGHFPSKSAFVSKKVCYEVALCKNCQWRGYKAFAHWPIENHTNMVDGEVPST